MTMTAQDFRGAAKAVNERIASMEASYGRGVRPAWVGEEIAMLHAEAERYLARAMELEKQTAI